MMKKTSLICIAVLMALSACSKPQEGEVYFPEASKGDQWEYFVKVKKGDGDVIDGKMTIRVAGKETVDGKRYRKSVTILSGANAKEQFSYSRRTKEGIYKKEGNMPEYLATPFPIIVGKTWETYPPDGKMLFMADKKETITLFNKEYKDALKISFKGERRSVPVEGFSYFAPGVGEVITMMKMGDVFIEYALDKYKL